MNIPLISTQEQAALTTSLLFLKVEELKTLARALLLPDNGAKKQIINRILHFLQTGQKINAPTIPAVSRAQRGKEYPLKASTLMLKGAYKNDLVTRLFFKALIGPHFHFTAYGIDWLNERWLSGNPPTYQEFAHMWQAEHERRAIMPAAPKEEWAYINFIQAFLNHSPHASREIVMLAWERERLRNKAIAEGILAPILK